MRQPLSQMAPIAPLSRDSPSGSHRSVVQQRQQVNKAQADAARSARPSTFKQGQYVRVRRPRLQNKLHPVLSTPLQVTAKIGADTYLLEGGQKWHADQLVAVDGPVQGQKPSEEVPVAVKSRPKRARRIPEALEDFMLDVDC